MVAIAMAFLLGACGTGGEVVRVTTVKESPINGLRESDLAKLEEIKKARDAKDIDDSLSNLIYQTQHFSVPEYLMRYSKAGRPPGVDYTVGGYDILNIKIYEEPDLSREAVRVSRDGYISFPLIGRIKVADLTPSEIEDLISHKLGKEEYLLGAHVSVMVTEYKSKRYFVLGAVRGAGIYPLQARERVLDAISRGGGIDSAQASKKAMIIRTENPDTLQERKIVIDINLQALLKGEDQISNIYLTDKDVLFVPTADHYYIIGQVSSPGSYALTDREITLVEAIGMAGGFTSIAARNRTRIIRVEDGVEKIIQVNVDAITKAGKKIQDVPIKPGDVIVVPESFF
jgi:polysaccharide export outer membrane protein